MLSTLVSLVISSFVGGEIGRFGSNYRIVGRLTLAIIGGSQNIKVHTEAFQEGEEETSQFLN